MNVIDSLTKGFQTVNRHLWLILIPVLLDVFLWLGPQASIEQVLIQAIEVVQTELVDVPQELEFDLAEALRTRPEDLQINFNAFSALRVGTLAVPSLTAWGSISLTPRSAYEALWVVFLEAIGMPDMLGAVSDAEFMRVPTWQISTQGVWLLLNLSLSIVGILIGSIYLAAISNRLNDSQAPPPFGAQVLKLAVRFLLFGVLRIVALLVTGIPLVLALLILTALVPGLAFLFAIIAVGIVVWLSFYTIFFAAALAMNYASVWRALWNSVNVVMRSFWATFWLFLMINLIGGGLAILWRTLSIGSWPTFVSIVGNAYVGTSLLAASLAFYQDRYGRWQEALAELLSKGNRRMA